MPVKKKMTNRGRRIGQTHALDLLDAFHALKMLVFANEEDKETRTRIIKEIDETTALLMECFDSEKDECAKYFPPIKQKIEHIWELTAHYEIPSYFDHPEELIN